MRGATYQCPSPFGFRSYFNPHSPCGERRVAARISAPILPISIHTPHAGSDCTTQLDRYRLFNFNPHSPCGERLVLLERNSAIASYFNPHSPCGERLYDDQETVRIDRISIHTPHAGSDICWIRQLLSESYFNPHSPCGERLLPNPAEARPCIFQSTLPMRGATFASIIASMTVLFQSTLPMRGATCIFSFDRVPKLSFQSTLPMRGATDTYLQYGWKRGISIHTPHAGSDSKSYRIHIKFKNKIYDIRNKNKL